MVIVAAREVAARENAAELWWHRWVYRSLLSMSALALIYAIASLTLGWSTMADAVAGLWASGRLQLVIGLVFLGVGLRAARWHYFIRHLGWIVPLWPSLVAFVASFALTATPGKAGEVVKAALLRERYGIPVAQSAGVLVIERQTDLIAVLILAVGGAIAFSALHAYAIVAAVLMGIGFVVLAAHGFHDWVLDWLPRTAWLNALTARLRELLRTIRALLRPTPLAIGVGLALLSWSAEAGAMAVLANALLATPVEVSLWMACAIFGLATLAGALSMLPGGVGGFEAATVWIFVQLGATAANSAVVAMIFRLCTLWLMSVIGLAFMLTWLLLGSRAAR
jgi:uncharacterized protein (TIRG00374 family)